MWLEGYDDLPVRSYESVSWEFGNFIQKLSFLKTGQDSVPAEIRGVDLPNNVDQLRATQVRHESLLGQDVQMHELLDDWLAHRTYQIDPRERYLADFVREMLGFSLFALRFQELDLEITSLEWRGVSVSSLYVNASREWVNVIVSVQQRLIGIHSEMQRNQPGDIQTLAFTDEMRDWLLNA
jgi:hypothetical protein